MNNPRKTIHTLLLAAGVVSAGPAFAASGTFTFVTGEVAVQRPSGQRVPVTKGTAVNPGDAIVTGKQGMAQLTMVDQARISLRPNTQFQIERYGDRPDSDTGALLNLVRGTLRTFTGLISSSARDKFVMKTKVATVGIRGSGNVLFAGEAADCDPAKVANAGAGGGCDITVNHTIEGSHAVTFGDFSGPGLPPQQGGAATLITGPGQSVLVTGRGDVKYIPTPSFIAEAATNPAGGAKGQSTGGTGDAGPTRNFGPGDGSAPLTQQNTSQGTPVGNNGLGFTVVDATGNLGADPADLRDVVISTSGGPFAGQAAGPDVTYEGAALRAYRAYAGSQSGTTPTIVGGTARDVQTVTDNGAGITIGRWEGASLGFFGASSATPVAGGIHFAYAASGYPTYLSDVLTGTVSYALAAATSPTNQLGTAGRLDSATLNVNFTNRTLNAALGITLPAVGSNGGGTWSATAQNVPFSLNAFYASTSDRLVITNTGSGQTSTSNGGLTGSLEGSFVGRALQGAILGYRLSDTTGSSANRNQVAGVAAFTAPGQDSAAPYRDGLVSDPSESLASGVTQVRTYATINRPAEVTADAAGAVSEFAAPFSSYGGHALYQRGTASVAQSGIDPETGMVWGRWAGGTATVSNGAGQSTNLNLANASLHYIFAGAQSGPVNLPLTGTAVYDVIGSTNPTDRSGHVGTLNTATLNADFTRRTVDALLNVTVNGQVWNGVANSMPIYRDQYFSAYTPSTIPGGSSTSQLILTCQPNCGPIQGGSLDGFFAGRTGQRAGVNYNFNGVTGAVALGRRGG